MKILNINKYAKSKCAFGCELFNDKDYSYWEFRKQTTDEVLILKYIKDLNLSEKKKILHIGIGNSYIARNLNNYITIDGISISSKEIDLSNSLRLKNYNTYFQNKYSVENIVGKILNNYDIIIDNNIKSYSCCQKAFDGLFELYTKILNKNGIIITSLDGMSWSRNVKPIYSFSIKNFFHKRLKEIDGGVKNILSLNECEELSKKHKIKLQINNEYKILFFVNE